MSLEPRSRTFNETLARSLFFHFRNPGYVGGCQDFLGSNRLGSLTGDVLYGIVASMINGWLTRNPEDPGSEQSRGLSLASRPN